MKLYPTPYQWRKVFTTITITGFLTACFYWFEPGLIGKVVIILLFILLHFAFGFLQVGEFKQIIRSVLKRKQSE
jgi:hypothetical protein